MKAEPFQQINTIIAAGLFCCYQDLITTMSLVPFTGCRQDGEFLDRRDSTRGKWGQILILYNLKFQSVLRDVGSYNALPFPSGMDGSDFFLFNPPSLPGARFSCMTAKDKTPFPFEK
jgi:hypothetical protein